MIEWLQQWYFKYCDGYWEHENGILIDTLDNPGWLVKIDLSNTKLDGIEIPYSMHEKLDSDWYDYSIEKNVFKANGDPGKLNKILEIFKYIYESGGSVPD